jgi:hypothetical protein
MFILNQISGIGDFGIADNLRLIVIAAIFIGIVIVLLYLKSSKSGRKVKSEYVQAANSDDSSGKKKRHSADADAQDDFLSIEEEAEVMPVVNLDKTVTDIEEMEEGIDTKQEVDTKDVRAEFATKIEGLISKIEDVEKVVIRKVENIVDAKVQEVLNKIDDKIDEVLRSQEGSNALTSVKKINSLRQDEEPVFSETQEAIDDRDATSEALNTLPTEEKPIEIESFTQSKTVAAEKAELEEIAKSGLDVSDEDSDILGELASSLQMEVEEVSEETNKEDLEITSEAKEDIKAEEEEPIASSEKIEKSDSGEMAGESDDLDILDFLKEDSIGISLPDESSANGEIAELPEEIKEEFLEIPSEVSEDEKVEKKEPIASSEVKEKNVLEVDEGDSADFDIQEFLEELENLPSEKDSEDAK